VKHLLSLTLVSAGLLFFAGCGDDSSSDDATKVTQIDMAKLDGDYVVKYHPSNGLDYSIQYCKNNKIGDGHGGYAGIWSLTNGKVEVTTATNRTYTTAIFKTGERSHNEADTNETVKNIAMSVCGQL